MSSRDRTLRLFLVVLPAALLLLGGCGLPAYIHDRIIGPISPAGFIHHLVVGREFHATSTGVTAKASDQAILRPFPPDFLDGGRPRSFYSIVRGLEAGIAGFSFVVERDGSRGTPLSAEALEGLRPGLTAREVLEQLGPPQRWIRRRHGAIMAYRAEVSHSISLYAGIPPFLTQLVPIPGVGNLFFRYTSNDQLAYKTLLLFDEADLLTLVVTGRPTPEEEE